MAQKPQKAAGAATTGAVRAAGQHQPEGQPGPERRDGQRQGPQRLDPERVDEFQRHEGQDAEQPDHGEIEPGAAAGNEEIEHHQVPDRREAREIIVLGLHLAIAEAIERGRHDEGGGRDFPARRHHAETEDQQCRDHRIGQIVDHEIEHGAVEARRIFADPDLARHRPVETVDDQGRAQPEQGEAEVARNQRRDRQQAGDDAGCREGMDGPGGGHAGFRLRGFVGLGLGIAHGK